MELQRLLERRGQERRQDTPSFISGCRCCPPEPAGLLRRQTHNPHTRSIFIHPNDPESLRCADIQFSKGSLLAQHVRGKPKAGAPSNRHKYSSPSGLLFFLFFVLLYWEASGLPENRQGWGTTRFLRGFFRGERAANSPCSDISSGLSKKGKVLKRRFSSSIHSEPDRYFPAPKSWCLLDNGCCFLFCKPPTPAVLWMALVQCKYFNWILLFWQLHCWAEWPFSRVSMQNVSALVIDTVHILIQRKLCSVT